MPDELQAYDFDASKLDLIKRTVAKGATQDEFELFLHACKRTGLDPLMKQIHAIKRWSAADQRETMAIQTGIDGYRLVAERTGKYAGNDDPVFEEKNALATSPIKATVTVWKMVDGQRCAFTASARWEEYVQKKKDGEITSFWKRMPYGQLAKCAEALALRKAFPAELSGVYTHEEMQQADNPSGTIVPQIPQVRPRSEATILESRQEDKAVAPALGESQPTLQTAERPDAPAPSAAEYCKQKADAMSDSPIFTFGKHKGQTPYDEKVPDDYLAWIEPMLAKQVNDPSKARYQAVNQALLDAVRAAMIDRNAMPLGE